AFDEVVDRSEKVNKEKNECRPGRGHVIVEDPLHVAHGLFGGSGHQRLIERKCQQCRGENEQDRKSTFHRVYTIVKSVHQVSKFQSFKVSKTHLCQRMSLKP